MQRPPQQIQFSVPITTPVVKKLLIANITIWAVAVMFFQNFFLAHGEIFNYFGLVPFKTITEFFIWQPFTYMFLHSENIFHILFNNAYPLDVRFRAGTDLGKAFFPDLLFGLWDRCWGYISGWLVDLLF